jgi:electron transfer flavoprotein alpha subunit
VTSIWVFIEQEGEKPSALGLELLAKGRELGEVTAIFLGPGSDAIFSTLGEHGAKRVLQLDSGDRLPSAPVAAALAERVAANPPDLILLGQAYNDRDVAGRLAAKLGVGVLSNASDVRLNGGGVETDHEILGGSQTATASASQGPYIVLARPKSFVAAPIGGEAAAIGGEAAAIGGEAAAIGGEAAAAGGGVPQVEKLDLPDVGGAEAKIAESHIEEREGPQLGDASIIVSGGRGLGSPEAYELVEKLGRQLKAATGATRAIVDAGWVPYAKQVGQTGKTVKPDVYIACGISGAMQHLVGMKDSKIIIAINKDADAPIFSIADLGVVGDVHKVLPKLIEALESR